MYHYINALWYGNPQQLETLIGSPILTFLHNGKNTEIMTTTEYVTINSEKLNLKCKEVCDENIRNYRIANKS